VRGLRHLHSHLFAGGEEHAVQPAVWPAPASLTGDPVNSVCAALIDGSHCGAGAALRRQSRHERRLATPHFVTQVVEVQLGALVARQLRVIGIRGVLAVDRHVAHEARHSVSLE
jgi:hypothetical protein